MKKNFSLVALATALMFSFSSCDKNNPKDEPEVKPEEKPVVDNSIQITMNSDIHFNDAVADNGWWQLQAWDSTFYVTLSNAGTIDHIAGTYNVADLDEEYSFVKYRKEEKEIAFLSGSVTLTVDGDVDKVTVIGQFLGEDSLTYKLNLVYNKPKAEQTKTVVIPNAELDEYYADYGLDGVYGRSDSVFVQLYIWFEDEFAGTFTEDDLDTQYEGSGVNDHGTVTDIFDAEIEVVANDNNTYTVTAALLCYNNTLYNVTMTTVADTEEDGGEDDENAPRRVSVRKAMKTKAAKAVRSL